MAKTKTKQKFVAFLKSESGDDYTIQFSGTEPKTDDDWLKLFAEHIDNDDVYAEDGPGIAGTYLHLEKLVKVK